jgi:hypothetical protein
MQKNIRKETKTTIDESKQRVITNLAIKKQEQTFFQVFERILFGRFSYFYIHV